MFRFAFLLSFCAGVAGPMLLATSLLAQVAPTPAPAPPNQIIAWVMQNPGIVAALAAALFLWYTNRLKITLNPQTPGPILPPPPPGPTPVVTPAPSFVNLIQTLLPIIIQLMTKAKMENNRLKEEAAKALLDDVVLMGVTAEQSAARVTSSQAP